MNHVSVSPTNGMGPHKDREKLTKITAALPTELQGGPISISRANARMVHMGWILSTSHHTLIS